MLKKVIPVVVVLCLIFGISAMAETATTVTDGSAGEKSQQMLQEGERPQGGRGNMGMPRGGEMQGEFTPPGRVASQNGELDASQSNANTGSTETVIPSINDGVTENEQMQNNFGWSNQPQLENRQFDGQMPGGMGNFPGNMQSFNGQTQESQPKGFLGFVETYSTPIISVVLLGLAFIFIIFYRRKNY